MIKISSEKISDIQKHACTHSFILNTNIRWILATLSILNVVNYLLNPNQIHLIIIEIALKINFKYNFNYHDAKISAIINKIFLNCLEYFVK